MTEKNKYIPRIAALMQIAFYASHLVPEYKNLSVEERTRKIEDDYFMALKIADAVFEKARHEKLPPEYRHIIGRYVS